MKHFSILTFGIFIVLVSSFLGLILSSQNQIGNLLQSTESLELNDSGEAVIIDGDPLYPQKYSGLDQQGHFEYIKLGCAQCHTQQIRRNAISSDIERGLSSRISVPRDYITQPTVLIGTTRIGPDLIDIGSRRSSRNWHYLHLYNPNITSPGSIMPSFPFLFDTIKLDDSGTPPNALMFPEEHINILQDNTAVIPSRRAEALVEYLLNQKIDYDLPETALKENETGKKEH
tara:strand:- start:215 stop:904 length:690 start_codon:yes stop_codon:yes gene_type:complete